jgi:hypothetical protein
MTGDYFDDRMVNRQRLLWMIATRRQLERWEPIVAEGVRRAVAGRQLDDVDIWSAEIEHHFTLVAARHLIEALAFDPAASVPVDPTVRDELVEGRNLHEHWRENLPVFNVTPRAQAPRRSGRDFAARNPDRGPYWWLGFDHKSGALLLPHVGAPALHQLLDAVEAEVLSEDPSLATFMPPRAPSPWIHEDGEWWPKQIEPRER